MANQEILAPFTNEGVPATGLSPTIRIRDVSDGSLVVTDAAMTETGDGNYKYTFTDYDSNKEYAIRCDGGASLPNAERYTFGGNENYIDDAEHADGAIWIDYLNGSDNNTGLSRSPVKTFSVAKVRAAERNMSILRVRNMLLNTTLTEGLTGFDIISDTKLGLYKVDFNSQPVYGAHFKGMGLTGSVAEFDPLRIIHYHMNESTGTNVPDTSGNGNHGTTNNMDDTNWVAAKIGNGLRFDGPAQDEYIDCGNGIAAFERTDPFTFEAWVKTTASGTGYIVSRVVPTDNGIGWWISTLSTDGEIQFVLQHDGVGAPVRIQVRTDLTDGSFIAINDDSWHHLVCTYDGSSTAAGTDIWIDNVQQILNVVNDNLDDSILSGDPPLYIGRRGWGTGVNFTGEMDEVVIYSKVLNNVEISERYNGGQGTEDTGLDFTVSSEDCVHYSPMSLLGGSFIRGMFLCNSGEKFALRRDTNRFVDCYTGAVDGDDYVNPVFDLSGANQDVVFRGWRGGIVMDGLDDGQSQVEVGIATGSVEVLATCTSGTITVWGDCTLIDNSGVSCTVIDNRAALGSDVNTVLTTVSGIDTNLNRALGLMQENYFLDQTTYTTYLGAKLLTSGRIRIYSNPASVGTANDVVATYNITSNWTDDELDDYKVVKQ